jgi:hypothetical protein
MFPACPAMFTPMPATLDRVKLPSVAVTVVGIEIYRSYDLEHQRHYRRAMAMLSTGTVVGLRRIRF